MVDFKSSSTPLEVGVQIFNSMIPSTPYEKHEMANITYSQAIGSPMYLGPHIRPRLAYPVTIFAQLLSNPSPMHWSSVQHIFQYVQGTKNIGILYAPTYGPAYTRTSLLTCLNTQLAISKPPRVDIYILGE